jgi:hypothetical protein
VSPPPHLLLLALPVARYEDNFDAVNNAVVLIEKTDKKSIEDFGDAEKFLTNITYLLGEQSYFGEQLLWC